MKTLYLFIDESGNFDFSPKGTRFFVLTILSTTNPYDIGAPLLKLRYDLLQNYACGPRMEEQGYFHASEDAQQVRNAVFSILSKIDCAMRIDSVIAQKNRAAPLFHQEPMRFYKMLGETALKYASTRAEWQGFGQVVAVFSGILDRKKRGMLKQTFKLFIKEFAKMQFALYFHDSKFDLCTQVVDYFCWAIYRKWESNDDRSYALVQHLVKSEFLIFDRGGTKYYEYKK
jgi:hypothetical protein